MTGIPAALAARPRDRHRDIPIPYANLVLPDGRVDFTAIDARRSLECARKRKCGLCGLAIGWWLAFLGGRKSAETRAYLDPPMHVECAEAATTLCPYIRIGGMQRRKTPLAESHVPRGFTERRPAEFVIYVTRAYTWQITPDLSLLYRPAPAKHLIAVTTWGS